MGLEADQEGFMFTRAIPVLHVDNADDARSFYGDLLGFEVLFEHRFGDGMPVYLGLRKGDVELHLSEHANDGVSGGAARFEVEGLHAFHGTLQGIDMPGVETKPWGYHELVLTDPSGNRLLFVERV
jgi:catechol 2,3-dioxygenase-like lactoylglutathione lyase family enzyme